MDEPGLNRRDLLRTTTAFLFLPEVQPPRYKNVLAVRRDEGWREVWCPKKGGRVSRYHIHPIVYVSYNVTDTVRALNCVDDQWTFAEARFDVVSDWGLPLEQYLDAERRREDPSLRILEIVKACYHHMKLCHRQPQYPIESVERWLTEGI